MVKNKINWIIIFGMFMRIAYMLYTPMTVRSHDLGALDINATGHEAYLLNLMEGHLPYTNEFQFYQQPFYFMSGILMGRYGAYLERKRYGTTVKILFYGYSIFSILMYLWIV